MIVGSGRPSVNVEGHGTFSGSVVVVVVVVVLSVDSEEVPPRRGILSLGRYDITNAEINVTSTTIRIKEKLRGAASVIS
jgi:hypothetical protein